MKVVAWINEQGVRKHGRLVGDRLEVLVGRWGSLHPTGEMAAADSVRLIAPVRPSSIICVGLNYRLHAEESGLEVPTTPALFTKLPSSLIGPGDAIVRPTQTTMLDYEAELGVVIGTTAKAVSVADALAHVAGYVCVNDVSARDLQRGDGYGWVRGKSADTFCPVGPYVLTSDEVPDPQRLMIRAFVNDEERQNSTTADMIFSVAEIVSHLSQTLTLRPGDLICTGTPSGVADGMKPPRYLQPGDRVAIEIEGLGRLENEVRA